MEVPIQHHGRTKTLRAIGVQSAGGDHQQLRRALGGIALPRFDIFEHLLAKAAVRIPEEQQMACAAQGAQVDGIAVQIRKREFRHQFSLCQWRRHEGIGDQGVNGVGARSNRAGDPAR